MVGLEGEQGIEGNPGFYTFVRHLGKMGPPSSLLFLTIDGEKDEGTQEEEKEDEEERDVKG